MSSKDFNGISLSEKRKMMVDTQIISRGVKDPRVIKAMLEVPRHLFVSSEYIDQAYEDYPLPIGYGQTISQPYMVAIMTELLELDNTHKILEIGTGSGYQTAILASIAKEVYTVERVPELSKRAKEILEKLGFDNIKFKVGDGSLGWPEYAPYDRIIVTAAAPDIPDPLKEQLKEGGIIVIPVGERIGQILLKGVKEKGTIKTQDLFPCAFVPLKGEYGF